VVNDFILNYPLNHVLCDFLRCNEEEQHDIKTQQYKNANHSVNSTTIAPPVPLDRNLYLGVYSVLAIGLLILTTLRTQLFYRITIAGSRILHSKMFYGLLRAPSYFFDTNSIGKSSRTLEDLMLQFLWSFCRTILLQYSPSSLLSSKSLCCHT